MVEKRADLQDKATSAEKCVCELTNSEEAFPHDTLSTMEDNASKCNSEITSQKTLELESLLLGLERRLPQLQDDVSVLEKEDDGGLYGVLSLQVIENEIMDIKQLIDKLNSTTLGHQLLTIETTKQLENLKAEMQELEKYDTMQVVKRQQANQRLKRELNQCRNGLHSTIQPTQPQHGNCPHGQFLNITGPRVYTAGEYPGSYKYGAWGRDPKPEAGKESWYWLVMMTSSNRYSHYVRLYSSLSSLIVGVSIPGNVLIHSSNPTTNTIQGPNVVMYGEALYYNCYNQDAVCRFNLSTKTVTTLQLPKGTRFNSKGNFCHLDECYPYTDLDLATDESGVWVIYTTSQDFGNLVLSKVEEGEQLMLGQTWHTSVYKLGVTNTFIACGVLYVTRFVNKDVEEIFYSFDTVTGEEKFNIGVFISKMAPNIYALNYSPVDQMLHAYCDSYMVSYKVLFG
ncbi:olfactomedin-4-like isoform X2 [Xiphias gladius]|uniref:olfactomedin-4-like isoform X2 n=1 Tax=Xiphias gladius TaxID=8245 RepID=UPI001A9A02FF|nr:olfactomedin-4-like isoform X2 [Xiphias gladius]XP_039990148.1 olfactomedin-4-like isoform X2 [Xiphias gladius]XP_039990149.1 olfactomedin-4-like isoform X2 [Xiphias gladius]